MTSLKFLIVGLGHELTHAYDAATNPRRHYLLQLLKSLGGTGRELEMHPRRVEHDLFHYYGLPSGFDVLR